MKKIFLPFSALCIFSTSSAQITLNQNDFPQASFNKDYYSDYGDSIDVGGSGANQVFDFSKLVNQHDTFNVEFSSPSNTPFPSQHNQADLAYLDDVEYDSVNNNLVLQVWQYLENTSQESRFMGISAKIDTGYVFHGLPSTGTIDVHATYSPMVALVSTQNTYNSNHTFQGGFSVNIGSLKHDEYTTREVEVDAYGTFKNPWVQFDALRFKIREIYSGTDSVNGQQSDAYSDTSHYYEYWTKNFGFWVARAYTDENYNMINGADVAAITSPVGLEKNEVFMDLEMFPNPVQEVLFVNNPFEKVLTYQLRNANGQKVLAGIIPAESYRIGIDVGRLSKGLYFLEVSELNQAFKVMIE